MFPSRLGWWSHGYLFYNSSLSCTYMIYRLFRITFNIPIFLNASGKPGIFHTSKDSPEWREA